MAKPDAKSISMTAPGALVGAMAVAASGVSVTYAPTAPQGTTVSGTDAMMNAQDMAIIDGKIDLKLAKQETDIKLNTQGLADLKARFDDLAKRLADVPTNIATVTERVSHLPTKDELGTKLRNYMLLGVALVGMIVGVATFAMKFIHVTNVAAT